MTVRLKHYDQGPPDAPVVLLAPSLGTTLAVWDGLAERLADRYRVIRFDTRGHGASPVPGGPYSVEELTEDVLALTEELGITHFGFAGLSLGGAIGQVLALRHPDRVACLVLAATGPKFADPKTWLDRAADVRADGMGPLAGPTAARWFTPEFRESHPDEVERVVDMLTTTPPVGYAACCDALASFDLTLRLGEITAPTRVIAGSEDPVSGPAVAEVLASGIPGADLVVLDGVSHIANVAAPDEFDAAVTEHLGRHL